MKNKKGIENIVFIAIGVVVLAIAVGAVAYPVSVSIFNTSGAMMNSGNVLAIDRTIAPYINTFILLAILIGIVVMAVLGGMKGRS